MSDDKTPSGAKVEVSESAKAAAAEMVTAYEDRPTAVLPGSHNTVTGTAVNDWLDDDGNPKFGKSDSE
ncbi:hypothetical protein [Mycobacterium sp. MS1601]|uniref:hypothetical protein n=1 Tax=Mycobacterium sp. MS1601 TaxID=1936029 RepID=UPI0012F71639|nr:hypothetical protein [Mycobacterium sp. MS1601]